MKYFSLKTNEVPSIPTSFNETALAICINFDIITVGIVTAPNSIPDEAPGLKYEINHSFVLERKKIIIIIKRKSLI